MTANSSSFVSEYFAQINAVDPIFLKLKHLLLSGRRAEAIKLICSNDSRFQEADAQSLIELILGTLNETNVDLKQNSD